MTELEQAQARIKELEKIIQRKNLWAACHCIRKHTPEFDVSPGNHHEMRCRNYIGPVEHKMRCRGLNPTFGGDDYDCSCGSYYRQAGWAGHGGDDEQIGDPIICRNIDEVWRGPK